MALFNGNAFPDLPPDLEYPYIHIQKISYGSGGGFMAHLRCSDQPLVLEGGVWSFGGVGLPPLPPRDVAVYPNAYIGTAAEYPGGGVIVYGHELTYTDTTVELGFTYGLAGVGAKFRKYKSFGGEPWTLCEEGVTTVPYQPAMADVWGTTDVYDTNGTLVHAAGEPPVLTAGAIVSADGAQVLVRTYYSERSDYVWGAPYTAADISLSLEPDTVIWCNADILDENGNVFLKASEPEPEATVTVPWFSLQHYMTGYTLGLSGSPSPFNTAAGADPLVDSGQTDSAPAVAGDAVSMLLGWMSGKLTGGKK